MADVTVGIEGGADPGSVVRGALAGGGVRVVDLAPGGGGRPPDVVVRAWPPRDGGWAPPGATAVRLVAVASPADAAAAVSAGADAVVPPGEPALLAAQVRAAVRGIRAERVRTGALVRDATHDHLTGLLNRRGFEAQAAREVLRSHRYERPLALAMVDIDHFKAVNDRLGHAAGDAVLREVARRLARRTRAGELLGRVGGEEFAWVMPETLPGDAHRAADRMRLAVSDDPVPGAGAVTVSIGLAVLELGESLDELLARADRALYAAKADGRDRVRRDSGFSGREQGLVVARDVERFLAATEAGDDARVRRVGGAVSAVRGRAALYGSVVEPALDLVGERWERGEIPVSTERAVSLAATRLLEGCAGDVRAPDDGPLVVLACAPGNAHRLGLIAASDLFTREGWRTVTLGPGVGAAACADVARRLGASAVGISAGTDADLETVEVLSRHLRTELPGCALLIGGGALRRHPEWRPPPGVHAAHDARETAALAAALAG